MNVKRKRERKRREVIPHQAPAPRPLHQVVAVALLAHLLPHRLQMMKRRVDLDETAIENCRTRLEGWGLIPNREVPNAQLEYTH